MPHAREFIAEVADWLQDTRPVDPEEAIAGVFDVLSRNVEIGQVEKIKGILLKPIREIWVRARAVA